MKEAGPLAGPDPMGKLRALQTNLAKLAPRIGYLPGDEKGRNRQRSASQPWRAWYKTAAWRRLARAVYERDGYVCQRSGELCVGKAPAPNSPVANHKMPHRGDPYLFWDINNLETVAKRVHDSDIQREEQATPRGNWR